MQINSTEMDNKIAQSSGSTPALPSEMELNTKKRHYCHHCKRKRFETEMHTIIRNWKSGRKSWICLQCEDSRFDTGWKYFENRNKK